MKKLAILILSLFILAKAQAQTADSIIRLPLTYKVGFGPFPQTGGGIGWDDTSRTNPWYKTYLPVKGIPADWTDVKKGMLFFDIHQFVYQNYIAGNITHDRYLELQTAWNWKPDTTQLSKKPITCYVYIVSGKNKEGKKMLLIDSQNKLDVSGETPFEPAKLTIKKPYQAQIEENLHQVSHQRLQDGKIIAVTSPVLIMGDSLQTWACIPQYATTVFTTGGKTFPLSVASNFVSDDLANASVTLLQGNPTTPNFSRTDSIIAKDEYITIDHKVYQNKGVTADMLNLQPVTDTDNLYSTQLGYKAMLFSGKQFDTGKQISLADYKGKYVFVDFWGTWCGPCRAELPYLKKTYDSVDKSKVAFIGIVSDDDYNSLKPVLDKEGITWPHILSGGDNNITLLYNINMWPTNFLLDPQGRIVARNLRGNMLATKLKELLKTDQVQ
jgi:thiol-disulfide isomerase/thioredoxin